MQGTVYALGGESSSGPVATVEAYSQASSAWTTVAPMPTARHGLAAVAANDGRIYAFGGGNTPGNPGGYDFLSTVEAYTPGANVWTTVAPMPTARNGVAAAAALDGRIYVFGGQAQIGSYSSTVEVYDPSTNSWTAAAPMPTARYYAAAVTAPDGRIYVFGGWNHLAGEHLTTVEIYSPSTNTWATGPSMPTPRQAPGGGLSCDGRILAAGGGNFTGVLSSIDAFSLATNQWTSATAMNSPRWGVAVATDGRGRLYSLGGYGTGDIPTGTVEMLDTPCP